MAPSVLVYGDKRITVDSPAPTFSLTERQRKERCRGSQNRQIEPGLGVFEVGIVWSGAGG